MNNHMQRYNSRLISGYAALLKGAIAFERNGSVVELDISTARAILEIVEAAQISAKQLETRGKALA